jgi:hypothetical protein
MILQIIGARALETYAFHLPRMFCDIADGMGEDRGVMFDDEKLTEICLTLKMDQPGAWGYKNLPNRVYFGFGPLYDPAGIEILLKKDVLEPPLKKFDPSEVITRRIKAEPDRSAFDAGMEDGVVVALMTEFANKDFWVDLGDAADIDPSRVELVVHDLDWMLETKGRSIVHHLQYGGKPLEFREGSGDEVDYEIKTIETGRYLE